MGFASLTVSQVNVIRNILTFVSVWEDKFQLSSLEIFNLLIKTVNWLTSQNNMIFMFFVTSLSFTSRLVAVLNQIHSTV